MHEPSKILYQDLKDDADKRKMEKVEEVYRAYRTKCESHWWRGTNEAPIAGGSIDCSVREIDENGKIHTANAWANFTFAKIEKNPTSFADVKMLFDNYYRPAAEDENYGGKPIPPFDDFLDIQKNSWLAAAQAAYRLQLNQDSQENEPASRLSMSR